MTHFRKVSVDTLLSFDTLINVLHNNCETQETWFSKNMKKKMIGLAKQSAAK